MDMTLEIRKKRVLNTTVILNYLHASTSCISIELNCYKTAAVYTGSLQIILFILTHISVNMIGYSDISQSILLAGR